MGLDINFKTMDLSRPLTDRHEISTSLVWGQTLKPTFDFFFTTALILARENVTYRRLAVNRKRI